MPATSPRLALPFIQPSQAQKHVTHNEALQLLDAVVQLRIRAFGLAQPPGDPAAGDVFALGVGSQGDWSGQDGRLALWDGTGWLFLDPQDGWLAWDAMDEGLRVLNDGAWTPATPALQNLPGLGIGTASDATNRLAVAAHATLLSHAGAGHQVKVNKAGASDTASLLFQSGWTGHAEMGLAGGLDFTLKVSNGTAWATALSAAHGTGVVSLPQGAVIGGPVTGSAVQSSVTDGTPGRLLTVGAFGLGGPLPAARDISASLVPGFHAYDTAAGSSGGPAGVLRGTLHHARRGASAGETQTLVVEAGSAANVVPGLTFGRARSGGGWSAWTCGAGTQSETGANGRIVRDQDGTQTCWHTLTTSASADTVWTFPQPFTSATGLVVTMGIGGSTLAPLFPRHTAKGPASVAVSVVDSAGARVSATLDMIAIGRWA